MIIRATPARLNGNSIALGDERRLKPVRAELATLQSPAKWRDVAVKCAAGRHLMADRGGKIDVMLYDE